MKERVKKKIEAHLPINIVIFKNVQSKIDMNCVLSNTL